MPNTKQLIKTKLFDRWLPDKPGGLDGLLDLAAEAAAEVASDPDCGHAEVIASLVAKVEDLTERLHFAEVETNEEEGEDEEGDEKDGPGSPPHSELFEYDCPDCNHPHKTDSKIGQEHLAGYYRAQAIANVDPVSPGDTAGK